jgi:hypothetical protein
MQYYFELYFLQDDLTVDHWQKLYDAILQYGGRFEEFDLIFRVTDNVVRVFISSNKDISVLSNNIEAILLRPVEAAEVALPAATRKERLVSFRSGGNILDLKERMHVKRQKDLQFVRLNVRTIQSKKAIVKAELIFKGFGDVWFVNKKLLTLFPAHLFAINFTANTRYLKKQVPTYLDIEKSLHMLMSENMNALFEADTFPYLSRNYYLNVTNYEFDKHSFIIGASGSGKSKFISLFVDRLAKTALNMNYRVVVIDPHASLAEDFSSIQSSKIITFDGESAELFAGPGADVSAATELTTTLLKSLLADQFNARLERTLRFSLYVLFTAQAMSLDMLKRFLTDIELRNQMLQHVESYIPPNITKFFGADFNEIRTQYHNEAILPIVSLVDEMQLQPALVGQGDVSLAKTINDNFLTVFSLNKVSMGEKVVKTVAGLIIQQVFLLAQARAFNQKVILIIDEVSVVQNPALAAILAEARKYNLFVFLTQQYFGQIEDDLKAAIFANVYNYYVFRVSEEDAKALEGNLKMEIPRDVIEQENARGIKEEALRIRMLTELHPRECVVRLLSRGQLASCLKVRTLDAPAPIAKKIDFQKYIMDPSAQNGPTKFVEQAQQQLAPVAQPLPQAHAPSVMPSQSVPNAPEPIVAAPPPPQPAMNLNELLAAQSSAKSNDQRKETT